ncbi:MAG: filamentous hemagglutinin N-terminal domain-containing protein [Leptolyngbya sp. UWPOB_LEPTO1]|uniref:two-partner secretion domain-containing protein n=1 Tax=Leptolyngbya sp. UWPOB_LEPTO1 TaxID=2815653 RepID=UPI001ACBBFD7|nr:filamentous hemagglutinin N-terminal domain-containing protein [Leptolyngbya sp. UWPOB_LEPTO1]MBN8564835.1 filamentous hemagglutinin N-terminal domain-containing protein [Leptolyngbya sp. UWPOB_LEPTO1]
MKRLSFGLAIAICGLIASPVWGQSAIVPDSTLGASNSTIQETTIRGLPSTLIQGGSSQGANLFHSFLRFNIPVGRGAYFANPDGIKNIFSRVTGAEGSEIFGRLGVLGDANLFLMNPNGILFGQTGSLDVNGSFAATTANAIQFGDRGSFDTTNPPNSVLTIDPSAFLFTQVPTGKIVNRSIAPAGATPAGISLSGLKVSSGKSLLLVGGDINFDGGILSAVGGRIDLAGLSEPGTIELDQELRLNVQQNRIRANLSLSNGAVVGVAGAEGGEIVVNANRFTASSGGRLFTLLETTGNGADIIVNAKTIEFSGFETFISGVIQGVLPNASGQAGSLIISADHIKILSGAGISSINFGVGQGANIQIKANLIELIGNPSTEQNNTVLGSQARAEGKAGNVVVMTDSLIILDGAALSTSSYGTGQGGDLQVKADSITLAGGLLNSQGASSLGSLAYSEGDAGNVIISTRSLNIRNGAFVANSSYGAGRGGNLQVKADNVEIVGRSLDEQFSSFLGSLAFGSGNTRDVNISTEKLSIREGGALSTSSYGKGRGGNLEVQANLIDLVGVSPNESKPSVLGSLAYSEGSAGNVDIITGKLSIRDGSFLATSSDSIGQGGNLRVKADTVEIIGRTPNEEFSSFLGSLALRNGSAAGNTELITRSLRIVNGGSLSTSSLGKGKGGNLQVQADSIELIGASPITQQSSGITSQARAEGNAGNISVTTRFMAIRDGARLSTSTFDQGQGGNLKVEAQSLLLSRGTIAALSTGQGNAGNIQITINGNLNTLNSLIASASLQTAAGSISITADSIQLRGDSDIRTETGGRDRKGGDINLTARDYILALEDSDILAFSVEGQGGNITFNTPAFLSIPRYVPTLNQSPAFLDGNNRVDVNATGTVSGAIAGVPDITFLQNALNPLTQSSIDTNTLLAKSCIVRDRTTGAFFLKGSSGLPIRPGDLALAPFPTGTIQPTERSNSEIVEPQGVYQLADGRYIMSRECQ